MLQKGHTTSEVADIAICGDGDECLLASVSKDGELFVWNIIYTESYEPARHSTISSFCSYACTFTFFTAIRHLTLVGAARAALRSPLWGCIRLLTVRSLRKSDAWSTGASCGTRSSGASRRRRPAVPAARREPWVRGEERRAGVAQGLSLDRSVCRLLCIAGTELSGVALWRWGGTGAGTSPIPVDVRGRTQRPPPRNGGRRIRVSGMSHALN